MSNLLNTPNTITIPSDAVGKGHRVIKIATENSVEYYPLGISKLAQNQVVLDHLYYNHYYQAVAHLDANNKLDAIGTDGIIPSRIDLWISSGDPVHGEEGNVVLAITDSTKTHKMIIPVGPDIKHYTWDISSFYFGTWDIVRFSLRRLTDDSNDTLPVAAVVTDLRIS